MIFSKTSTETILSENPKNPENNPETWYVKKKLFESYDILYRLYVEKVLKNSIQ